MNRVKRGCGGEARDQRVELAAQADAEGRVQKGRHQCERGRDDADQGYAGGESGDADDREDQADQLGELQRRYGFALLDRSQPGRHEGGEHPPVGVPARAADGADREDHGLQAKNDRGRQRADRRDDQRDHQDRGRDPGGEPWPANVHAVDLRRGCYCLTRTTPSMPVARKRVEEQATVGSEAAPSAARKGAATQQLQQQQQQQPAMRHRSTARRLVSMGSRRADTSASLPNDMVVKPTAVVARTAGRRPWARRMPGNAVARRHQRSAW